MKNKQVSKFAGSMNVYNAGKKSKTLSGYETLPQGWVSTRLGEIATILLGLSPPSSTYNSVKNGLSFFQGKVDFGSIYPTARIWCTQPKRIVDRNTLLLSVRAPVGSINIR